MAATSFEADLPALRLNFARCLQSGQVFRWVPAGLGCWIGIDGASWYRISGATGEELGDASRGTGGNRDPGRDGTRALGRTADSSPRLVRVETNADEDSFHRLFRLEQDDPAIVAAILAADPQLEPYMASHAGLRLMRPADVTETFFTFLCTANNHVPRIRAMVCRLAEFGDVLAVVAGRTLHRFPDLERIAAISAEEMRTLGFGYRADTIRSAAAEVMKRGGASFLEELRGKSYAETHADLLTIPYIGPKLADCIALYGLDHTQAVPVDTHIWQAATRLYFPQWRGTNLTAAKYRAVGDHFRSRFGGHAAHVQQILFYDNHLNWRSRG